MTYYETKHGYVNQLDNIINAINNRSKKHKAAYTIYIQKPGCETIRPRGGPCLNYIAVQIEKKETSEIGLLCVYRSHDFLERAYGNYWGLTQYICQRTFSPSFGTTFQVMEVTARTSILFHKGNHEGDTAGCILLGQYFDKLSSHERAVLNSGLTFENFMMLMENDYQFHLTIREEY